MNKKLITILLILVFSVFPMFINQAQGAITKPMIGWAGYITSTTMATTVMNQIKSDGCGYIRYMSYPSWLCSYTPHQTNLAVIDKIVSLADGTIVVVLDVIHNYPPPSTSTKMQNNFAKWKSSLLSVAKRYNGKSNVILECANEYDKSDAMTKYQNIVTYLRSNGITLRLHFNYWWGTVGKLVPPTDPLKKVSIGHHVYGDKDSDNTAMRTGETWVAYCTRLGIESIMKKYFTSSETTWFGYALSKGYKVLLTECGGSHYDRFSRYDVAFVMRLMEYCKKYNVGISVFRIGDESMRSQFLSYAQTWFKRSFYPA